MKITIEISEDRIRELVEQAITDMIVAEFRNESGVDYRAARYGVREGVDKAVKQYIYQKKDAIIENVIDRATKEVVRKGLPKFLERSIGE